MSRCYAASKRTVGFAVVVSLLLTFGLLTGCGSSTGSVTTGGAGSTTTAPGTTAGSATTARPTTTAGAGGGSAAQTVQVIMINRAYDPKQITVNVGDTVTWVNQDAPKHDVVADSGEFKSSLFDKGQSWSFTFAKAGTYPYHCSIHPGMIGTVIVQ